MAHLFSPFVLDRKSPPPFVVPSFFFFPFLFYARPFSRLAGNSGPFFFGVGKVPGPSPFFFLGLYLF